MKRRNVAAALALPMMATMVPAAASALPEGPVNDVQIAQSGISNVGSWYDDGVLPDSVLNTVLPILPLGPVNLTAKSSSRAHWSGDLKLSDRVGPGALQRLLAPDLQGKLRQAVGEQNYALIRAYFDSCRAMGIEPSLTIVTVSRDTAFWSYYSAEGSYDFGFIVAKDQAVCLDPPMYTTRLRNVDPSGKTSVVDDKVYLALGQNVCANPGFGVVHAKWYANGIPPQYVYQTKYRDHEVVKERVVHDAAPCPSPCPPQVIVVNGGYAPAPMQTYVSTGAPTPYASSGYIQPWYQSTKVTMVQNQWQWQYQTPPPGKDTPPPTGGGTKPPLPLPPPGGTGSPTNAGGIGAGSGTGNGPGTGPQPGDTAGGTRPGGTRPLPTAN